MTASLATTGSAMFALGLGRQEKCNSILQIPPEIRVHIYRYAISQDKPVKITGETGNPALSILGVCRLFREEATKCYYNENTFLLSDYTSALIWMNRIEPYHDFIRRVQIEVDVSPLDAESLAAMGLPQGGFDPQWKRIVEMVATNFDQLEALDLVVVAHYLQAVHPDAQPREHRYRELAEMLEGFHKNDQQQAPDNPLMLFKALCPKLREFRLISPFSVDWVALHCDQLAFVDNDDTDEEGRTSYTLTDPPPIEIDSSDDEDEDEDDEDVDDDDDDGDDDQ